MDVSKKTYTRVMGIMNNFFFNLAFIVEAVSHVALNQYLNTADQVFITVGPGSYHTCLDLSHVWSGLSFCWDVQSFYKRGKIGGFPLGT